MTNLKLSALNRRESWANGIYNKIAEFIDADQEWLAVFLEHREAGELRSYPDSPARFAATARRNEALRALPFWLRWIFA